MPGIENSQVRHAEGSRTYILRCRREAGQPGDDPSWRLILIEVGGRESRHGFCGVLELMDFLRSELILRIPNASYSTTTGDGE
jgi:hypothetical protein